MKLRLAQQQDIDFLLPLVADYHALELISSTASARRNALLPLLSENSALGKVWLISEQSQLVGYIALCFGYSIEIGGKDAFIDEFFIVESARGQGIGAAVLEEVKTHTGQSGIAALHLEVGTKNLRAKKLYAKAGFSSRERFHLMTCKL